MPHHLYLIASAGENLHAVMRDFKRFTSRQIRDRLKDDGRVTILDWLEQADQRARRFREEAGREGLANLTECEHNNGCLTVIATTGLRDLPVTPPSFD